jgi:hypothetical protein
MVKLKKKKFIIFFSFTPLSLLFLSTFIELTARDSTSTTLDIAVVAMGAQVEIVWFYLSKLEWTIGH